MKFVAKCMRHYRESEVTYKDPDDPKAKDRTFRVDTEYRLVPGIVRVPDVVFCKGIPDELAGKFKVAEEIGAPAPAARQTRKQKREKSTRMEMVEPNRTEVVVV